MLLKDVASTRVTCPHCGTVQRSAQHPVCRTCGRRLDRSSAPPPAGSTAPPPVARSLKSDVPVRHPLALGLLGSAGVVSVALVGLFVAGSYVIIVGGLVVAGAARILTPAASRLRAGIPGLVELFWAAAVPVAFASGEMQTYPGLFLVGGPLSSAIVWALGRGSPIGLAVCAARYAVTGALFVGAFGLFFSGCFDSPECGVGREARAAVVFLAALAVLIPAVSGVALIAWPGPQQRAPAL